MRNSLIDVLVIGLLLLVFGSIYRTRKTLRLRYWIVGWLLVLLHFAVSQARPAGNLANGISEGVYIAALAAGGLYFLLASSGICDAPSPGWRRQTLLLAPFVAYIFLVAFGVTNRLALSLLFLAAEASLLWLVQEAWSARPRVALSTTACVLAAAAWAGYEIHAQSALAGVSPILMEVFLISAPVYWSGFRRRSTGVYTATVGFIAWGAVFPVGVAIGFLSPHLHVPAEVWNLPKYVVEFGMILTLLEAELLQQTRQREEYQVMFEGNPYPMWIIATDTLRFLKVNAAAVAQYGYSEWEFLTKTLREIRPPEDIPRMEQIIHKAKDAILNTGPWTHVRRDGSKIQVEISSHGVEFEGRPARFVLVQDVTERQQLHERLVHQAHHDALTGLPNRLLLEDRMTQMMAAARRVGYPAAVLCMDIDHFKQINDTYGHHAGDVCLQHVATVLRERLREADTVARSGGEEFVVLLSRLTAPGDAGRVAEALLGSLRQAFTFDGRRIALTASVGVAVYPTDGSDISTLWRLADAAMYRAKRAGGDSYAAAAESGSSRPELPAPAARPANAANAPRR